MEAVEHPSAGCAYHKDPEILYHVSPWSSENTKYSQPLTLQNFWVLGILFRITNFLIIIIIILSAINL